MVTKDDLSKGLEGAHSLDHDADPGHGPAAVRDRDRVPDLRVQLDALTVRTL
jgi:hypothetical protein